MLKKFYVVNDYKDLYSGNVIPHKVLNYLPVGPMVGVMPITKSPGLTIPVGAQPMGLPLGLPIMNAYNPNVSVSRTLIGPPIIKLSPMINQNASGEIRIILGNNTFTMTVPYNNIRDVVNEIYMSVNTGLDATKPKITFRIVTPSLDSSISTTYDKMMEIVKTINDKYANVVYRTSAGKEETLSALLQLLAESLGEKTANYVPL
jgi:hypothetical protein